jgi:hypothetical protein
MIPHLRSHLFLFELLQTVDDGQQARVEKGTIGVTIRFSLFWLRSEAWIIVGLSEISHTEHEM